MKRVICWGTGKWAEKSINQLEDSQYEIVGFCDMDKCKQGKCFHAYPVFSLEELKQMVGSVDGIIVTMFRSSVINDIYDNGLEKHILGFWDYRRIKLCDYMEFCSQTHYSQLGEDVYLESVFEGEGKNNLTYVDVGAYHPYMLSNTMWAYQKREIGGGIGLNIEPNVDAFRLFEKLRPNDINVNCGISDVEGIMDYYVLDAGAMNTFNYDEICDKKRIQEVKKVKIRRLDSILAEYKIKHIDFMDIDVEGYEMNVLRSIDFDAVDIEYILLEHLGNRSLESVVESEKYKFLKSKGYEAVSKYGVTVIYHKKEK